MKRSKGNFLQMKNSSGKKYKGSKSLRTSRTKNFRYIEDKMRNNEKVRVIEITPRLSSIDLSDNGLTFNEKVDIVANKLKDEILQMHKEGHGVRFIGQQLDISRELARNVIKGTGSLRIIAMQRVPYYEFLSKKN